VVDFNAADLLTPDGQLEAGWFTGKTPNEVVAMLGGFVDGIPSSVSVLDGDAVAQLDAVNAWAYGQGYLWLKADYGSRTGTVVLPNEITQQTTKEAADTFGELAKYWLDQFYALVPGATPVTTKPRSTSVSARFRP
jgi:hypothetical protein